MRRETIDQQSVQDDNSRFNNTGRKNLLLEAIFGLASAIGVLIFLFWFVIIVPRDMARERGREEVAWIVVSVIGSPFLAIVLLWFLGPFATSED